MLITGYWMLDSRFWILDPQGSMLLSSYSTAHEEITSWVAKKGNTKSTQTPYNLKIGHKSIYATF
jgi:hypothetical protein